MNRVILTIEGMQCGMCEAHVCEAIRNACDDKKAKISASHTEGKAEIRTEGAVDVARIRSAVRKSGYRVTAVNAEPWEPEKRRRQKKTGRFPQ